ncbi:MotE family protein [Falsibacillus pallidus]|uniref:Flagellar motility protein MotE (MotC chaperone) n=1 Tax=Falsibacillus pallidus TaxID=493781 RepID=A0A370GW17_9BACI|nr:MotE family protein [Falsibacillus pallidus]RDI47456.1 flagellar motility protein MotE (MotC chaperone) [Falsibacillus pallidus]
MSKTLEKGLEDKREKNNKFQWFVMVIFIPVLFAITIALIVLTFAGVNVFEKGKQIGEHIPFISGMLNKDSNTAIKEYESKMTSLEAVIKDKEGQIDQLSNKIEAQADEKDKLLLEQERLQQEIGELKQIQDDNKKAFKEIVHTYETMSPKSAAPIILKMKDDEAVHILSQISNESLAQILEQMPPANAAKYTEKLSALQTN